MLLLDGQVHHDTHAVPKGNYVIGVGNYLIATPSKLGNYKIADMVGAVYGPPCLLAKICKLDWQLDWHWFGSDVFHYGEALSLLPGVILTARLAPRVAYRRRDALTLLFFPPAGIRVAWIIGTRVGQLPHRDWPGRTGGLQLQGRQAARIAVGVNRYRLWRQRRTGKETAAVESAQSCHTHATGDGALTDHSSMHRLPGHPEPFGDLGTGVPRIQ